MIDTPQTKLMNAIEAPLASERVFGDQYMSHCDQVCMAVAIDDKCCLKSTKRKVNLSYFNLQTLCKFYSYEATQQTSMKIYFAGISGASRHSYQRNVGS